MVMCWSLQEDRDSRSEGKVKALLALGSRGGTRTCGPTGGWGHGSSGLLAKRGPAFYSTTTGGHCCRFCFVLQFHPSH